MTALDLPSLRDRAPALLMFSLLAAFIVLLPRYTDTAKIAFFFLILSGFVVFVLNLAQVAQTSSRERLYLAAVVVNFAWMAFSFYYNGEPGRGASVLWGRHFYLLFLIPLFFAFRRAAIREDLLLLCLFASVSISLIDIGIDLAQGVDHRQQGMNPNSFGPIQLCLAGILFLYSIHRQDRWQRLLAATGCCIALATVILSKSKGTWVILPVLVVFFGFYLNRSETIARRATIVAAILLLIASSYVFPIVNQRVDHGIDSVANYFASDDFRDDSRLGTFGTRMELWKAAWKIFRERPVVGAGLGSFRVLAGENWEQYEVNQIVSRFKYVHNQYLAALATRGIPGLLLFLAVLLLPVYLALSESPDSRERDFARQCLILICLAYAVDCLFEDPFEGKSSTMFFTVTVSYFLARLSAGYRIVKRRES